MKIRPLQLLLKSSNFIVLALCFGVFCAVFEPAKISTNILDLFPKTEPREILDVYSEIAGGGEILLYTLDSPAALDSIPQIAQITAIKENFYALRLENSANLEEIYDDFAAQVRTLKDARYFSPEILRLENTRAIFSDVNAILAASVSFLVLLYLFILRAPFLSLNTLSTIISANLLGISGICAAFENVNVMALEFGVAIGNLAIDYMLHHHFFRLYMHRFSFNKSVFYGFLTTFLGFGVCFFVPFPLLSQLSLYAMICLLVSYLSFGFLYQFIGFKKPIFYRNLRKARRPKLPNKIALLASILCFLIALPNLKLDYDLEKLDYENKPRLADRAFFEANLDKTATFLVVGESKGDLAKNIAKVLEIIPAAALKSDPNAAKIVESGGRFYAKLDISPDIALNLAPDSPSSLAALDFVDSRSAKQLNDAITTGIYKPMIAMLVGVIVLMTGIVAALTRSFVSLSYTLAPLAGICAFFAFNEVNIMHLFSLLIVVVSSVDYGIYVHNEGENIRTLHAIIFSSVTTIAGFGFLGFSHILALKSFGLTIIVGLCVILALLLLQKRQFKN